MLPTVAGWAKRGDRAARVVRAHGVGLGSQRRCRSRRSKEHPAAVTDCPGLAQKGHSLVSWHAGGAWPLSSSACAKVATGRPDRPRQELDRQAG
jgi:hypothetical protein